MSALKTTADPALPGRAIARDQARALLGHVMGLVAVDAHPILGLARTAQPVRRWPARLTQTFGARSEQ
jgi:hypothetical protein